ncbi:MAG TPA: hypothetical protein VFL47_15390, partial [Flavisolibacter sp.]|nr:hypothetical protein [Flavisolibacter sp.]
VPVSLWHRGLAYLLPYILLLLPECTYILYAADRFSFSQRLAYGINLPVALSLLTAIQYSEAQSREEYLKACFALVFLSIFVLHVQAFWFWIGAQTVIAILLFANGYSKYERMDE